MMKILKHRILIIVVCLSVLSLGCIEEENHKIELPIDTPEEAIEYAKTNNTIKEWIEAYSELGYEIIEDVSVDNQSIWYVQFEVMTPMVSRSYIIIKMHPNGTILSGWGGSI